MVPYPGEVGGKAPSALVRGDGFRFPHPRNAP